MIEELGMGQVGRKEGLEVSEEGTDYTQHQIYSYSSPTIAGRNLISLLSI